MVIRIFTGPMVELEGSGFLVGFLPSELSSPMEEHRQIGVQANDSASPCPKWRTDSPILRAYLQSSSERFSVGEAPYLRSAQSKQEPEQNFHHTAPSSRDYFFMHVARLSDLKPRPNARKAPEWAKVRANVAPWVPGHMLSARL